MDWDQNGAITYEDEWIELYNLNPQPVFLGGWAVADATHAFTLPLGTVIWPHGYLVLFRGQTHLALGDDQDVVALLRPDGSKADSYAYTKGPGADVSYCRIPDGTGGWTRGCRPTLGEANRIIPPSPTPTATPVPPEREPEARPGSPSRSAQPSLVMIWAARRMVEGAQVTISGTVTMLPGPLGKRIYIEDETAGIGVYLRSGEYPPLALGDVIVVTGRLNNYHGEMQVEVNSPTGIAMVGHGRMVVPLRIGTGAVGEEYEGRLVWVMGRAIAFDPDEITVDDGSGPARVYFPAGLTWRRPYVRVGEVIAVRGIVGQYAIKKPYVGGYRLVPRHAADIGMAPAFLPVTGKQSRPIHER